MKYLSPLVAKNNLNNTLFRVNKQRYPNICLFCIWGFIQLFLGFAFMGSMTSFVNFSPSIFAIKATPIHATPAEQNDLSTYLTDFTLYNLPTAALYDTLKAVLYGHRNTLINLQLGEQIEWVMQLERNNIFANEMPLRYVDKNGRRKHEAIALQTFEGTLLGFEGSYVTLSVARDFVVATVFDGKNTYTLQNLWPANNRPQKTGQPSLTKVVLYQQAALRTTFVAHCAVQDSLLMPANNASPRLQPNPAPPLNPANRQDPCLETVQLALAADYGLLQKLGSAELVGKYMGAVVNALQAPYNVVGLKIQISEIYVETCTTCNSFGTNSNAFALLDDFLNYARSSNSPFTLPYHVAQLWTARDMDGSTVGLAKLGGVCTNNRYCTIQDYSPMFDRIRVLAAHELGHTFNAAHDASTSTYLMRPVVSEFCTQFSPQSALAINNCVQLRPCFTTCQTCKGSPSFVLQNYIGTAADLQWAAGSHNNYRLRWKMSATTNWDNEIVTTDTTYHISNLQPCAAYDFSLETICAPNTYSTPQTFSHKGVYLPSQTVSYPSAGNVLVSWTNNTIVGAWPMQLRLRESGSVSWQQTIDVTANIYTFSGLDICKNYELSLRAACADNGTFGRDTLLSLRGARAYNVSGEGLSPTQAQIVYYTTNTAATYTLRARQVGTTTWLSEIPNALAGTYYNLSGLTPCTSYEVQAQAYCGTSGGNVTTTTFQSASMAIQTAEVSSCYPENATYDLAVKIGHSHFEGNTLWLQVGGNTYPFTYNAAGPQICTINNLPANNAQNFTLTARDATFPNQCASSIYFDAPRPQCACSTIWGEDFEQCVFPPGWQNQAVGASNNAFWQIGKTAANNSLNGTCMAFFDDDNFDQNGDETTLLSTPTFDLSHYDEVRLRFLYNFHTIDGAFKVEVFDGSQWWQAAQLTSSNCGFWGCEYDEADIDLSVFLNNQLKIRFRYEDGDGWDWYIGIDSLRLCGYSALNTCNASFYYPADTLCTGGAAVWPIISGQPNGTFTATPTGLSMEANNGRINPLASIAGNYTVSYTVSTGCTTTAQVRIENPCKVKIIPRLFLQGAYLSTGLMNTQLRASNLLPPTQPYGIAPWNYSGTESYVLSTTVPSNATDWVLLELRNATTPATIIARKAVILQSDGYLREVGASSSAQGISFSGVNEGAYYLVVKHRNHLSVASAAPLWLTNHTLQFPTYDFSTSATQAYNALQIEVASGRFALLAGDINGDGVISRADCNRYLQQNGLSGGYFASDLTIDKNVNTTDFGLWRVHAGKLTHNWLR